MARTIKCDGVLQDRRNGAVVFRRDDEDAVGAADLVLVLHHLCRQ
jgi:hypothetical protein